MSTEQSNIGSRSGFRFRDIKLPSFTLPKSLAGREMAAAAGISALWILLILGYGAGFFGLFGELAAPRTPVFLELSLFALALVLPLLFVWICAYLIWNTRVVNYDARELHRIIAGMEDALSRHTPVTQMDLEGTVETSIQKSLHTAMLHQRDAINDDYSRLAAEISELGRRQTELAETLAAMNAERSREKLELAALVTTSAREITQKVPKAANATRKARKKPVEDLGEQSALPLESPPATIGPEGLRWDDLLRALSFPENGEDKAGFEALRKVLPNRAVALLLQAAEDVLSMLAQEGVYMDDLQPRETDPEAWSDFVAGARGAEVAAVGAVHDEAALALSRGRMRSDTVFRDATLHFLRQFDGFLQEFVAMADADDILNLADTRTGRAFMLLARAGGTFD